MVKIYDITELKELETTVADILSLASGQAKDQAVVLALHGDLGAGKTTFVQSLAAKLGVKETVTSPTFVIMKQYELGGQYRMLVHVDAYRVESVDEMRVLRFVDLLKEKDTIICIEWAERIEELLPADSLHLFFELTGEKRTLTLKNEK